MSRDKYAAERRRQRRHDFELGCEKFAEMVNGKRGKSDSDRIRDEVQDAYTEIMMGQQLPPGLVATLSKEDATMIYPLRQQAIIAGRQCGKTNMVQEFLTSPEFIKSLPKEHK